ncbi:rCG54594, isoform CRA_d, partial [Rattus norvegicus]
METTSELNKSPTRPILYKALAPMNLYIKFFFLYQ